MMTHNFTNADHNEAIDAETSIGDALDALTELSNRLFARGGADHPLISWITSATIALEAIPWDDHYEAIEREVGEDAWWEETGE